MIFQSYYIAHSDNLTIGNISSYKNIMNKFIIKYIQKNKFISESKSDSDNTLIYSNALIYSKYYLYWKIYDCIYSDDIMNILYDIEYLD